jgi:hypothetical protein
MLVGIEPTSTAFVAIFAENWEALRATTSRGSDAPDTRARASTQSALWLHSDPVFGCQQIRSNLTERCNGNAFLLRRSYTTVSNGSARATYAPASVGFSSSWSPAAVALSA